MRLCAVLGLVLSLTSESAFGQSTDVRPGPALEFLAGYAGFVDDATVDHGIIGAAARVYLTPRLAVGPEIVHMRGPDSDRDLFLTGNLTFDVVRRRMATRGGSRRSSSRAVDSSATRIGLAPPISPHTRGHSRRVEASVPG